MVLFTIFWIYIAHCDKIQAKKYIRVWKIFSKHLEWRNKRRNGRGHSTWCWDDNKSYWSWSWKPILDGHNKRNAFIEKFQVVKVQMWFTFKARIIFGLVRVVAVEARSNNNLSRNLFFREIIDWLTYQVFCQKISDIFKLVVKWSRIYHK